jgi:soluble lytic murein transglycosylase-like protein
MKAGTSTTRDGNPTMASRFGVVVPSPKDVMHSHGVMVIVGVLLGLSIVLTPAGRARLDGWVSVVNGALSPASLDSVFVALPTTLTPEQARAARWIAKRHRVSRGATEQIVAAAFETGKLMRLDPYLLLAVISVESGFNPLAESRVGAKGLMQVMPEVHKEKFENNGGVQAALHPWANIQAGAAVLREYLDRFKTTEAALLAYVGVGPSGISEYPNRVMSIRDRLKAASKGRVLAQADTGEPTAPTSISARTASSL